MRSGSFQVRLLTVLSRLGFLSDLEHDGSIVWIYHAVCVWNDEMFMKMGYCGPADCTRRSSIIPTSFQFYPDYALNSEDIDSIFLSERGILYRSHEAVSDYPRTDLTHIPKLIMQYMESKYRDLNELSKKDKLFILPYLL